MYKFSEWLQLQEMPINKFQLLGQWGPDAKRAYGYNKQDTGILQNPQAVQKIHRLWNNTKEKFDLYFIRSNKARKQVEVGEVTPEWVKNNLDVDIQPNDDAITIIFTQNTGAEKIPMTAWTIAHRLGHAIRRDDIFSQYFYKEVIDDFRQILKDVYGKQKTYMQNDDDELYALANAVGTMKSIRQNNLRNFYEFIYELVAQYIITGHVKFNQLPQSLILKRRMAWGRPNNVTTSAKSPPNDVNMDHYAEKYEHYLDSIFNGLVGKIFVM